MSDRAPTENLAVRKPSLHPQMPTRDRAPTKIDLATQKEKTKRTALIVAAVLVVAVVTNRYINLRYPRHAGRFTSSSKVHER